MNKLLRHRLARRALLLAAALLLQSCAAPAEEAAALPTATPTSAGAPTRGTLATTTTGVTPAAEGAAAAGGISDPTLVLEAPVMSRPPLGVNVVDPVFGTTLRRVSDAADQGGFASHVYNQLQAFSADNQYLLLTGSDGYQVIRLSDLAPLTGFDASGWNDPRWHPRQPHVMVHFDSNDDTTVRVQTTDVDSGQTTTIFTFPAAYERVRVPQSFDELSEDGRWLAAMLTRQDGATVLVTLDMEQGALGAVLPLGDFYDGPCEPDPDWGEVEPDWVGVSPLGRYLVIQWVQTWGGGEEPLCRGLETYDIATGAFAGRVTAHHNHGDLGVAADGQTEVFMTTELSSPADNNRPAVVLYALPGAATVAAPQYLQVVDWTNEDHFSLQGPAGVGLISWGRFDDVADFPFQGELFLQYMDGSVLRLTHHRSSVCGYWVQPRASLSRDGRYVVFASDWLEGTGSDSCGGAYDLGQGDVYVIDLGATAVAASDHTYLPLTVG